MQAVVKQMSNETKILFSQISDPQLCWWSLIYLNESLQANPACSVAG